MAHFPPGILTRYGSLLREPFGRVHWAGTETATTSHGAIDGAVRSGRARRGGDPRPHLKHGRDRGSAATSRHVYMSEPGVVSSSPVSSQVFRPERIIGQPP